MSRIRVRLPFALLAIGLALALPAATTATFGGVNGRITFARYVAATNSLEIFSSSASGGSITQLTTSGQDHSSIFSDWSPDGTRIAFDSDRSNDVQIYTMDWDGANVQQVTTGAGFHGDPAWSPDGTRLAIEADWGDYPTNEGIWTIPATGASGPADAVRVTTLPKGSQFQSEPQFSPDGQWLVFGEYKMCRSIQRGRLGGAPNGCLSAIFRVGVDGHGLSQVTPWGLNASSPDWSPDGSRLTFDSCDSGRLGCTGDIYTSNPDGSNLTRIVKSPPVSNVANFRFDLANNPVWSPDGSRILYTHWVPGTGNTELVSVAPDGSDATVLVDGDFFQNKADWGTHP